jgi:MobC-like protein
MEQQNDFRKKWVTVRLNEQEYEALIRIYRESTCRQLSDYVRKTILNKPVNIKYRNVSIDDFLTEMLALKEELNAIGNNNNQSVKKLHGVEKHSDFLSWIFLNELNKTIFF